MSAKKPSAPIKETRDGREGKEETRYETFEPTAPEPTVFEVPKSCEIPPRKRNWIFKVLFYSEQVFFFFFFLHV